MNKRSRRIKIKKRKANKKLKLVGTLTAALIVLSVSTVVIVNNIDKENNKVTSEVQTNSNTFQSSINSDNTVNNIVTTKTTNILIVNKENSIDPDYMPHDLVIPNIASDKEIKVRKEVALKLEELFQAAKNDGIKLVAISGYRDYDYQQSLYEKSLETKGLDHTERYVAEAGYSEHQTGLALDLLCKDYMNLDEGFENTDAFRWLQENMSDYGFILRYLKGKESITGYNYEPWHIRYVGVELAKEIEAKGITLEEYVEAN